MKKIKAFLKTVHISDVAMTQYPANLWYEIYDLKPIVYFLFRGKDLVYIGYTLDIRERIKTHSVRFTFDKIAIAGCKDKSTATWLERKCINHFKPANSKLPEITGASNIELEFENICKVENKTPDQMKSEILTHFVLNYKLLKLCRP